MLPKENRLKKKRDFEEVFKKGKTFRESFLFLRVKENNLKQNRFGFIVSSKISKKAVVRNKIKRRLREITKEYLPRVKTGVDVVLITKPGIETKGFPEIKEILIKLFEKAGIF